MSAGVSPALVAERLGHDIQTLMRTYAHVIRSDDERVRAVVDEHLGVSAEDFLRTERLRGVPYTGPDLRKPFETTSTPRSAGCRVACGGRGGPIAPLRQRPRRSWLRVVASGHARPGRSLRRRAGAVRRWSGVGRSRQDVR
ncbi:MAG: hypothetical protein ACRD0C_06780, partial [Acidimicrobiia bacterium]